ncbi:phage holin family protein [Cellulomonas fengjieae]|uniref:Phage holin family protein n=1 Tax=Cellulomonas fengjieae TaxID=2819978 RepID=A0ABS3SC39_9CELL|nr:phage holin family protein [Cellulomonas fengjieae]MBO3083306.1 phage holin family protein [Cellulomonas fengjieae]MBO3101946.1 phage holin family protein [Cellulomonas fengjieae]QVI65345.1 phage holin family protein [Cellulomonas fengjieae]
MTTQSGPPGDEKSLGQLVSELSEQGARLVRAEIDLAKAEITGRVQKLGLGAALVAAGALLGLYLLGAGIATVIIVLDLWLDLWLAALIVCVLLLVVIAILVLLGIKRIKAGAPPTPARAIDNVQQDIAAVKAGFTA